MAAAGEMAMWTRTINAHTAQSQLKQQSEEGRPARPSAVRDPDLLMTTQDLAVRWSCSRKKLEADRLRGTGCRFIRVGRLVRYRLADVEAYERSRLCSSTSEVRR